MSDIQKSKTYTIQQKELEYQQYLAKMAENAKGDINALKSFNANNTYVKPAKTINVTIKKGMSLYEIAEMYTGSGNNWQQIYLDNKMLFESMNASPQELNKLIGKVLVVTI